MIRPLLLRSIALLQGGRRAEARAALDAAVRAEPRVAAVRVAAATARFVLGDYQDAMAELEQAAVIAPGAAATTAMKIDFTRRLGWYHESLAAIARALAVDPRRATLHVIAAKLFLLKQSHGAALRHLDAAIALEPASARLIIERAGVLAALGRGQMLTSIRCGERAMASRWEGDPALADILGAVVALAADAEALFAQGTCSEVAELLERALAALGGNRTITPTTLSREGRLVRVVAPVTPRYASRAALERIAVEPAEEVLRAFDEVIREHPGSGLPRCYRGELYLWLGRDAEARDDFEQLLAVHPRTRWAYVGLALLEILRGDPEAALAISARGVRQMSDTLGPAVFAVRGEALRLLGQLDAARRDLTTAITVNPTRVSSWINLGLAHGAAGDVLAQAAVLARLKEQAAALLSDASSDLGVRMWDGTEVAPRAIEAVLTRALAVMRGNRSSSCVTYFSRSGQLRVVTQAPDGRGTIHAQDADDLARLRTQLEARRSR